MLSRRAMMNDEIVSEQGKNLVLQKCKGSYLHGMKVYGHTTQQTTTGAQLLDGNNLEIGGLAGNSGILVDANNRIRITDINVEQGNVYTLSGYNQNYVLQNSHIFDADGNRLGNFDSGTSMLQGGISLSLCFKKSDDAYMTSTDVDFLASNLMLNAGSAALPWEPYTGRKPSPNPDYPQELVSAGDKGSIETVVIERNLIAFPYVSKSGTLNGITYEISDDGVVTANGTTDAGTNFYLCKKITLYPGTYMLSGMNDFSGMNLLVYDPDKKVLLCILKAGEESAMFTVDKKYSSVMVYLNIGKAVVTVAGKAYPMLQHGTESTAYEPYKAQTLTMLTPNGLPGIPVSSGGNYTDENGQQWTADYRDWERGVDVQRVGKCVFDGNDNENWRLIGGYNKFNIDLTMPGYLDSDGFSMLLCTHFVYDSRSYYDLQDVIGCVIRHNILYINFGSESEITSLELLKTYLNNNPITIQYILAEPIETSISPEELATYHALHTNTPTTTIVNDEDCWMEVTHRRLRG